MEKDNYLLLYKSVAEPPENAKTPIKGGRIKGFTDINPMWRIKALTEAFGVCGIGWTYTIDKQWLEAGANGTVCGFCNITLYIRDENGEWSRGIPGTGGSAFVAKESNGVYTSDEVYKMALTDALSVACKALGFGANVYWEGGRDSKYSRISEDKEVAKPKEEYKCCRCGKKFEEWVSPKGVKQTAKQMYYLSKQKNGEPICGECKAKKEKEVAENE